MKDLRLFLKDVGWFVKLPAEKQTKFRYHLGELLGLLDHEA